MISMELILNAYSTVREEVPFTGPGAPPTSQRALADAAMLSLSPTKDARALRRHLDEFERVAGQQGVDRAGDYTALVHGVVQHIRHTRRQYVFRREEADLARDGGIGNLAEWAREANAIVLFPDGTLRNAEGEDVLDPSRLTDPTFHGVPHPAAARERAQRVRAQLREEGYPIAASLPPVLDVSEALVRGINETLRRAAALTLHALWAQAELRGEFPEKPGIPQDQLTETELHARDTKDPDALLQAAWSIEAARVLAWIVGFVDLDPTRLDLADPQELYDALGFDNDEVSEVKLRSLQEMCEAWERTFSLRWYGVEMRVRRLQGAPIPDTARELTEQEESILLERHHAFAWFLEPLVPSYDRVDLST